MDDKIMKIKFKGYFFLFAFALGLNHVCQEFYIMQILCTIFGPSGKGWMNNESGEISWIGIKI